MYVIKRSGDKEKVQFDKITNRLNKLLYNDLDKNIDPVLITQKICSRIYSGITTTELDNLASQICMSMITDHPDFGTLGSRIVISNHQKNTSESLLDVVLELKNNRDIHNEIASLVSDELVDIVQKNSDQIQNMMDMNRDYLLDYFGFKTLERSYLLKTNKKPIKKIVERPQHLFMRVAIGIHGEDFDSVKKTYDNMSLKKYTHATPTLFNAGTNHPQLSSCYLLGTDDSVEGIFETMTDCAKISKWSGGIGLHISNIRANGSYIRKTAGTSDGIMPMLKVYNDIARYINQGGGKRNGSIAIYLEPHHGDIFTFLEAKKNTGPEEIRARDLFYALWISDYFMECVEKDNDWYLMDPDQSRELNNIYGEEYTNLYKQYITENKFIKKVKSRELWECIISSQIEHGLPYICYKDHVNRKNNQKHYGTIKSSNLCVSGDTMILTSNGYFPIKELKNKDVEVWNGKEWSKTQVKQTGENQKIINVNFSNGMYLKCTPYHKFYIETGSRPAEKSEPILIEAKDLKNGMKIISYYTELIKDNKIDMNFPYTHGLFCADGTYSVPLEENIRRCSYKKINNSDFCGRHQHNIKEFHINDNICSALCYSIRPLLSLYGDKMKLIEYINYDSKGECENKINLILPYDINNKYFVPINNSMNSKIRWLEGYLDGDGCIIENMGIKNIQFISIYKEFLQNILYLLQTLGIFCQIKLMRKELLPDGKKGGQKYYNTKTQYRITIDSTGLYKLSKLGFSPKRLDITNLRLPHHDNNMYVKIEDIIDNNEYEDTFCFNESKEHKGIFNGILTGNCSEINEYSDKDETAVCNLGSICLPKVIEYANFGSKWRELLNDDEKNILSYYEEGDLKIYTLPDCSYCNLLKNLLTNCGLSYEEIDEEENDRLRFMCNKVEPFDSVPQLYSIKKNNNIEHLGGYDDNWKFLKPRINYNLLYELSYELTVNLNKVIDINFYPTDKTRNSNLKHRPIGLGVQGLADVFMILKLPFVSEEARIINMNIFETVYFGSMSASIDLAEIHGSYESYNGSPLSEGKFQYNLWDKNDDDLSGFWNWDLLRDKLLKYGSRNSLNIALMPTASTASIFGNNESFEVITSNLYTRNVLSGVFTMVNKYLINDLISLNIWDQDTKDRLIFDKGSVQNLKRLPKFLREVYKTAFEVDQRIIIKMSAERGLFVCQSQSLNLFFDKPTFKELTGCHFYGWKNGLKTGSYYIRTLSALSGQNYGLDPKKEKELKEEKIIEEEEGCLSCGA